MLRLREKPTPTPTPIHDNDTIYTYILDSNDILNITEEQATELTTILDKLNIKYTINKLPYRITLEMQTI